MPGSSSFTPSQKWVQASGLAVAMSWHFRTLDHKPRTFIKSSCEKRHSRLDKLIRARAVTKGNCTKVVTADRDDSYCTDLVVWMASYLCYLGLRTTSPAISRLHDLITPLHGPKVRVRRRPQSVRWHVVPRRWRIADKLTKWLTTTRLIRFTNCWPLAAISNTVCTTFLHCYSSSFAQLSNHSRWGH